MTEEIDPAELARQQGTRDRGGAVEVPEVGSVANAADLAREQGARDVASVLRQKRMRLTGLRECNTCSCWSTVSQWGWEAGFRP